MGYDPQLDEAEELCREAEEKSISEDAAVFVRRGYSRPQAMAKAQEINAYQREAEGDITRTLATLAEAQSPVAPSDNPAQTKAIAKSLRKEFGD